LSHSYVSVYLHLVFSTKERKSLIKLEDQKLLWSYITGIANNHKMKCLAVGGMGDHIHILVSSNSEYGVAKIVNTLKSNSSKWMRGKDKTFAWQEGYGAFSVSQSGLEEVTEYIHNQAAHHRKRDFKQELFALLRLHGHEPDQWTLG
jgi:putative transposase